MLIITVLIGYVRSYKLYKVKLTGSTLLRCLKSFISLKIMSHNFIVTFTRCF